MYKSCKDCFHADAKQCEAFALCVPLELVQDYEACPCRKCHYDQTEEKEENKKKPFYRFPWF